MLNPKQRAILAAVRVNPGALDRLGIYARRHGFLRVLVFVSMAINSTQHRGRVVQRYGAQARGEIPKNRRHFWRATRQPLKASS